MQNDIKLNVEITKEKEKGLKRVNDILTEFIEITDKFILEHKITTNEMMIIAHTIIHRETTNNFNKICENKARQNILQNQIVGINNIKNGKILSVNDIKNYDNIS